MNKYFILIVSLFTFEFNTSKDVVEDIKKTAKEVVDTTNLASEMIKEEVKWASEYTARKVKYASEYNQFDQALDDAKNAEPGEVKKLPEIAPWNENLTWDKDKSHVQVVSWVPNMFLNYGYNEALKNKSGFKVPNLPVEIWVSLVPEAEEFIKKYRNTAAFKIANEKFEKYGSPGEISPLYKRLTQLFGLPPGDNRKRSFVIMWVNPKKDIFRPCIDREIVDKACLPDPKKLPKSYNLFDFVPASKEYRQWFDKRKETLYESTNPTAMPWTRMGYTYDWGSPNNPYGVAEFVLNPGSIIYIHKIIPTEEYGKTSKSN